MEFKPKTGQPVVVEITDTNLKDFITHLMIEAKINKAQTPVPHKVDLTGGGMAV